MTTRFATRFGGAGAPLEAANLNVALVVDGNVTASIFTSNADLFLDVVRDGLAVALRGLNAYTRIELRLGGPGFVEMLDVDEDLAELEDVLSALHRRVRARRGE